MMRFLTIGVVLTFGVCWAAGEAAAQFVDGEWVQRGEANIRKYRQTDVAFLVLDANGRIVADAEVRIEQTRHAFAVGWVLRGGFSADYQADAEVWRVFNAVSLESLTAWRSLQPDHENQWASHAVDTAAAAAQKHGLGLRWGAVLSADTFDLPEWVVPLGRAALFEASGKIVERVMAGYGSRLIDLDLCKSTLGHDRYSPAMLRLLAADVRAAAPQAGLRLGFSRALEGSRTFEVVTAMDRVLAERLPIEGFSIHERFGDRAVRQDLLEPAMLRLAKFGRSIVVGSLEVGGASAIETSVNMETVLRVMFADPTVAGIYFAGLRAEGLSDASAALFDEAGEPTGAGLMIDRLFREVWWTHESLRTDALGQAKARVFLGQHQVTATLPDGQVVTMPLRLDTRDESPRQVILMPVDVEAATEAAGVETGVRD